MALSDGSVADEAWVHVKTRVDNRTYPCGMHGRSVGRYGWKSVGIMTCQLPQGAAAIVVHTHIIGVVFHGDDNNWDAARRRNGELVFNVH